MALKDYIVQEIALDCEEGLLSRREALRRLGLLGVGATAAGVLLAACGDDSNTTSATSAASTAPATQRCFFPDVRIAVEGRARAVPQPVKRFVSPARTVSSSGSLAEASSPRGAVLVIHENRGLTPHIRTIPPAARRGRIHRAGRRPALRGGWHGEPAVGGRRDCGARERPGGTDDRRPPCRARRAGPPRTRAKLRPSASASGAG